MSIVNRRNAMIGWMTWKAAKWLAKDKARKAVPAVEDRRPNKAAIGLAGVAALAGSVLFWRKARRSTEAEAAGVGGGGGGAE